MKKILMAFLCTTFLALPVLAENASKSVPAKAAAHANPPALSEPDSVTEIKLLQQKLDFFKERLDTQDKRIGDLGLFLGIAIAFFGALITGVMVFLSFRSTKEAVLEAKDESRRQAKEAVGNWVDKEGKLRLEDLLRPEIAAATKKIQDAASFVIGELDQEKQNAREHNQHQKELIDQLSKQMQNHIPSTPEQKEAVNEAAAKLESKAPVNYQFDDWLTLGIKAHQEGNLEIAAENFGKAAEAAVKPADGAQALFNKGVTLSQMGKNDEAIAVYDAVAQRYGTAPEAGLREQVANVLNGKGFALLCEAKKRWQGGDENAARAMLEQAKADVEAALARKPDAPIILGNRGYILFLQGDTEKAREILAHAIRLGGDKLRQDELNDADIYPLPQDEAFKALVNSL